MTRVDLILNLTKIKNANSSNSKVSMKIDDIQNKLIRGDISEEQAYAFLSEFLIINKVDEWYEIIRNKPIHRNLINILNGKITDHNEVAKIVSSMLTQLIIRKTVDHTLDLELLNFKVYLDLLDEYYNSGTIDIDKFKLIIEAYENLGIVKEDDVDA